jgi:hypothetical protein
LKVLSADLLGEKNTVCWLKKYAYKPSEKDACYFNIISERLLSGCKSETAAYDHRLGSAMTAL